ncbi:hypothetical protein [Mycolicibacterium psychrotolerans]|uniref:Uncharacterized protein n=1 Tax=Mycolicibacterium psychrotolerans TaxID=216929 RepID=A0A7I7MBB2_9MYCO|nr:hypothetical protein [Mycolicibacterium psychrotolerans]BBX68763.1 hypothetical protein MPSYJ_22240 [Mycolicibacterium psychrotolerans]
MDNCDIAIEQNVESDASSESDVGDFCGRSAIRGGDRSEDNRPIATVEQPSDNPACEPGWFTELAGQRGKRTFNERHGDH